MPPTITADLLQDAVAGHARLVRFTVDQYHEMIDSGAIPEDPRIELLDGLMVEKDRAKAGENPMSVGDRHRVAVMRLERLIPKFEKLGCFLQCQQPVAIAPNSEPEPDISVIEGSMDDFVERRPAASDALFVLEVSDSSLERDLGTKLRIYARGRIPCYVVLDLRHDLVLVHRKPKGIRYTDVTELRRDHVLRLPTGVAKHVSVPVASLL